TAVPSPSLSVGRGKPRWSLVSGLPTGSVQPAGSPASMAGLPASRAWVGVGPPLSWSGPSRGSPISGAGPAMVQPVRSPAGLGLLGVREPAQSGPVAAVLPARIVFASTAVPLELRTPPPVPPGPMVTLAELSLRVLLLMVRVPLLAIPPPAILT